MALDTSHPTTESEDFARTFGFEQVGSLDASQLNAREEVRNMCAADKCHAYDKNWACPPACGSIEDYDRLFKTYHTAVIVQTVAELEDEFDIEGMEEAGTLHKKRFMEYAEAVKSALGHAAEGISAGDSTKPAEDDKRAPLFLAAGCCTVCPTCTYPEAPCRFPDKALVSMEAAGLVVSDACTQAGIPYYHGKGTVSYTSCSLF